jgi:hypothetical protein
MPVGNTFCSYSRVARAGHVPQQKTTLRPAAFIFGMNSEDGRSRKHAFVGPIEKEDVSCPSLTIRFGVEPNNWDPPGTGKLPNSFAS